MRISVVMTFRNEGDQVAKTIDSLLKSVESTDGLDIVVINDCSDDNYDYQALKFYPKVRYFENETRLGSAVNKHEGVKLAMHDNILLVDAHMRFIDPTWSDVVESYIKKDSRKIYTLYTEGYNPETEGIEEFHHAGCFIRLDPKGVLKAKWCNKFLDEGNSSRIACIMGASYFFDRNYWNYLKGYEGLRLYGREEEFLSIKSWGLGNGCEMIKTCKIAHMYRKSSPNENYLEDVFNNIEVISETLFPSELQYVITDYFDKADYNLYCQMMKNLDRTKISELRQNFQQKGYAFDRFYHINQAVKRLNEYEDKDKLI